MAERTSQAALAVSDHWQQLPARWKHVGPPHTPSPDDLAFSADFIARWSRAHGAPRAMILGVTPQLYHLPWPAGTDLIAVDNSPAMIEKVWPGPPAAAILADWLTMDMPEGSRDIALTDGGLNMLSYPHGMTALFRSLHAILAPGGLFLARMYARPENPAPLDAVVADLNQGRIANLSILKTLLWMAIQGSPEEGVAVADVWEFFHRFEPDLDALAARIGWDPEQLRTLGTYRNSGNRYHFFSEDELRDVYSEVGGFRLDCVRSSSYDHGVSCPTVVLRRMPS
jgi:SAM-dependent methyltransferase